MCLCVGGKETISFASISQLQFSLHSSQTASVVVKVALNKLSGQCFFNLSFTTRRYDFFNQLNYRHISTLRCQHTHTKTRLPAVHPLRITSLHNTVSFFSQLIKPEENWWTWDMVHIKTYFINHWGEFYEKEVFGLGELWHHNEPMPGSIFFYFCGSSWTAG